jgi:3-hydroxymyristoyl/3-hydroxydecanoyl-(acyl carrier protein) dehydratase
MKFDLVDQILEQDDNSIVTVKNVTAAEEYLGDHFPSFPILPGVMMLESMVQAARKLLQATAGPGPWVLAEVRNVRYGNMVRPGQQLKVAVQIKKTTDGEFLMQGAGTVEDNTAVQGRFVLRPVRR